MQLRLTKPASGVGIAGPGTARGDERRFAVTSRGLAKPSVFAVVASALALLEGQGLFELGLGEPRGAQQHLAQAERRRAHPRAGCTHGFMSP